MSFDVAKYVVFKREDYEKLPPSVLGEIADGDIALDPATTFVLRQQDIIGQGTLRLYVSNALQLLEMHDSGMLALSSEQREHLEDVADGAASLADTWQGVHHKIPD